MSPQFWIFSIRWWGRGLQGTKAPTIMQVGLSPRETPPVYAGRAEPQGDLPQPRPAQALEARENLEEELRGICLRAEGSEA